LQGDKNVIEKYLKGQGPFPDEASAVFLLSALGSVLTDKAKGPFAYENILHLLEAAIPNKAGIDAAVSFLTSPEGEGSGYRFAGCPDAEAIANALASYLAESFAFAAVQRKNLNDDNTFNRHVVKSVSEMNRAISSLQALQGESGEIGYIYERYMEFVVSLNDAEHWREFYSLSDAAGFRSYVEEHKADILAMFEKGKVSAEALRPFILSGDQAAMDSLAGMYEEMLEDDPQLARQIKDSGLLDYLQ